MDINELIALGKQGNFAELEKYRNAEAQKIIDSASSLEQKRKLSQLHFVASNIRHQHRTAMQANLAASKNMFAMLKKLNEELSKLQLLLDE